MVTQEEWRAADVADGAAWIELRLTSSDPAALRRHLETALGPSSQELRLGTTRDEVELSLEPTWLGRAADLLAVLARHAVGPIHAEPLTSIEHDMRHAVARPACAHELPKLLALRLGHVWARWPLAPTCAAPCHATTTGPVRAARWRELLAGQDTPTFRRVVESLHRDREPKAWVPRLAALRERLDAERPGRSSGAGALAHVNHVPQYLRSGMPKVAIPILAVLDGERTIESVVRSLARDAGHLREARDACNALADVARGVVARDDAAATDALRAVSALAEAGFEAVSQWDWEPLVVLVAEAVRELEQAPHVVPPPAWILAPLLEVGTEEDVAARMSGREPPDAEARRLRSEAFSRLCCWLWIADEMPAGAMLPRAARRTGRSVREWDELAELAEYHYHRLEKRDWATPARAVAEQALATPWGA